MQKIFLLIPSRQRKRRVLRRFFPACDTSQLFDIVLINGEANLDHLVLGGVRGGIVLSHLDQLHHFLPR